MKLPIQYALTYPDRLASDFPRFNFFNYPQFTFEQADTKTFRKLALAYEAMYKGGNSPCAPRNEVAVQAFLKDKIGFLENMSDVIENCLQTIEYIKKPGYTDYVETDKETRERAKNLLHNY